MRNILIASFDMEVGGVERSLISLLENFDYFNNKVDLMLYRHSGDFMNLLADKHELLSEVKEYATYRKSIKEILKDKLYMLAITRILANLNSRIIGKIKNIDEIGYIQMQRMWKYALPLLPKLNKEYDVAISYLWPHYFVSEKVQAKRKIAWVHTDYSTIETDIDMDLKMWNKFDYIMAVSEECKNAFLKKYPILKDKVKVMENITSPDFIREMASENIEENIKNDNSFKLVSVARLSYAKGIDNAVRALRLLHNRGLTNIKWYVVGYGGDEEIIRNLIKENNLEDSFILLGKKINPYPYINVADIYVQPSRYEGKAVTVGEAQILGKPVVITNYTTAKSQVRDNVDGYVCKLSIEGIADGVEKLYKDKNLRIKLSENCKNTDYSNSSELENLYNIFD
ncbi:glycosyltransferase [uncultured Clostridium sp.]|uniref:glycosyltransferase n=1 Tax=uncultured Clostridium sp. TaxID=59620 RepID=UPI00267044EB|nr:glycosyltransferase [uncultured Clostridium sp.]